MIARACGLTINGTDLGTQFGLVLDDPGGVLSHAPRRFTALDVYGEDYQTVVSPVAAQEPRDITIVGHVLADSTAALVTAVDGLKQFLANGEVQVATNFSTTRYYKARLTKVDVGPFAPRLTARAATFEATLTCHDPMAWATTDTTVNFTTSATACALGTAISRGVLTITGGTNPLVTLANAAGTTQETMGFTLTLGGSDTITIDCIRKTVTKTIASVTTNAIADITSGSFPTFLALDPADGVQLSGTSPTLKVSSGAGQIVYRKRWR